MWEAPLTSTGLERRVFQKGRAPILQRAPRGQRAGGRPVVATGIVGVPREFFLNIILGAGTNCAAWELWPLSRKHPAEMVLPSRLRVRPQEGSVLAWAQRDFCGCFGPFLHIWPCLLFLVWGTTSCAFVRSFEGQLLGKHGVPCDVLHSPLFSHPEPSTQGRDLGLTLVYPQVGTFQGSPGEHWHPAQGRRLPLLMSCARPHVFIFCKCPGTFFRQDCEVSQGEDGKQMPVMFSEVGLPAPCFEHALAIPKLPGSRNICPQDLAFLIY